jgi:phosphatidylglycerol lysyltransferase
MNAPVKESAVPATGVAQRAAKVGASAIAQGRQAGRTPVTLGAVVLIWVLGAATGSLLAGPPAGDEQAAGAGSDLLAQVGAGVQNLTNGHIWTFVTSAFFASDLWTYIGSTVLLLVAGVAFERRHGSRRTLWVALGVQFVGAGLGVCAIWLASQLDWTWAQDLAAQFAVGPSVLVAGLAMVFSGGCSALWRRRIRLTIGTICVVMLLYGGMALDVLRLSTALVGLAAGVLLLHTGDHHLTARSSRRETRVLVALVVAATALGPILVAFTGGGNVDAPFAAVGLLYIGPDVADGDPIGAANTIMALIPALLVLVIAAGLRRGRAFAWWAGVVMHVLLVLLGAVFMVAYFQALDELGSELVDDGFNYVLYLLPVVLVPLVILVLLLLTRRVFSISAPAGTYRRFGLLVLGAFLGLWILYVVVGMAMGDHFVIGDPPDGGTPTIGDFALDFPLQLLPNGYDYVIGPDITPVGGGIAPFVADWAPVAFWLVVLVGMLRTFVTARITGQDADRERAREILERHGITTLAYMTTWQGNSYWFSADSQSYVAYRVEGGVAITTGDPVGPAGNLVRAVDEFVDFCNDRGWTPCLYSTTEATRQATDRLGWPSLQVAEETVLRLGSLAFSGKKFQDIRSSISRAKKAGITAEWIVFPDAPLSIRDQIEAISEEWVSDKALPEMGFTLGGIDELNDRHVRCLIAVDADRTVHGVTSWMPSYRDGVPVGWTLDFMRRRTAGDVKGIMEFLIGTAALDVQSEGAEFLSMSGAPLAQANPGSELTGVQKLLEYIGRTMEPVYGFRSLLRFKAKFQPEYEPMYMCYPEAAVLPRIGLGISHAYLPHLTMAQTVRMVGQLR